MTTTTAPAATEIAEGIGEFLRALAGDRNGTVKTTCWCERQIVEIPWQDFRDGIGGTCPHCE